MNMRIDVAAFSKGLLVLLLKDDAASFDKATIPSLDLSQEEVCGLIEGHSDLFQSMLTLRLFKKFVCSEEDF